MCRGRAGCWGQHGEVPGFRGGDKEGTTLPWPVPPTQQAGGAASSGILTGWEIAFLPGSVKQRAWAISREVN